MENILKIVISLEVFWVLLDGVSETIKIEAKEQKIKKINKKAQ